ncbi:hypothetical protein [Treponema sp. UBA3813]|uniref:ABC transporter substrate-binding protein n=1 Tax=Treponema sp. UBA3813 TaxID=1947715 RepID=UPI0025D38BB8|nr:hypothetical protein [Treponema sp. UBA3813]
MLKKIICLFSCFSLFLPLFAQKASIRLGVLKGISCAPCAYLIENKEKLAVQNISFQIFDSAQAELPKLLRGEIDMGFLTPEDAAKVFTAGKGALLMAGLVQNGGLYLLTNDELYVSLENLQEKNIFISEKDSSKIPLLKSLITKKEGEENGSGESFHFDFSLPLASIANKLIIGEAEYALLSEPFATVALKNSSKLIRAENIQQVYMEKENGNTIPSMILVVRVAFADENHDLVRQFLEVYRSGLQWTNNNHAKAAMLIEKHKLGLSQAVARDSIANASLVFRTAPSAKSDIEKYLTILGRELPAEEFYFAP